jgi:hypothetical protein
MDKVCTLLRKLGSTAQADHPGMMMGFSLSLSQGGDESPGFQKKIESTLNVLYHDICTLNC